MRGWIEKYATVSNAIAELIANRMTDGVMSNTANYFFLDRADQSKLVDLKIETNAKVTREHLSRIRHGTGSHSLVNSCERVDCT